MQFKDIINQEEIKNRLIKTVSEQRIPHAQLFFGPSGSGKLAMAIAYAKYICCLNRLEDDSCGVCSSCVKIQKLVHPDLHFVFPVLLTARVARDPVSDHFIEEWRSAVTANPYMDENQWYETIGAENKQGYISRNESNEIIRKLGMKSYESEFKVIIIWLPEKMNPSAANSLLKMIEEPFPKTIFLMVSENTGQILPTILSRTQLIRVPPLKNGVIREALIKQGVYDDELVEDAVRRSNGNYNMVLTVLQKDELELKYFDLFTSLMRLCFQRKIIEISELTEQIAALGRERQKQFLSYALRLVRENFMLYLKKEELSFLSVKEMAFSEKFNPYIHEGNVFEMTEQLNLAHSHIEANGNPKIIFMDLAIRLIMLLKLQNDAA